MRPNLRANGFGGGAISELIGANIATLFGTLL